MKTPDGFEITGGRMEDGKLVVDVAVPLRTLPETRYESWIMEATHIVKVVQLPYRQGDILRINQTIGDTTTVEVKVDKPECCWLPHNATEELRKPGMSTGDQRAWMDRFGCKAKAKWTIYAHDDPYDITESCDAHLEDLRGVDSIVVLV